MVVPSSSEVVAASTASLLQKADTIPGLVDYKGRPVCRSSSGGWKSAIFIIGLEVAETFAFYGMSLNLITYLTGPMGQSTATAAEHVNVWGGVGAMLPLLGAFVADSYLGRYRAIFFSSLAYILVSVVVLVSLAAFMFFTNFDEIDCMSANHYPFCDAKQGLGMLMLSASLPSLRPAVCSTPSCHSGPTTFQVTFFFSALYLVAFAGAGFKPCTQAFGADQFDPLDPAEGKAMSSFFNWWYFGICVGTFLSLSTVIYIQDHLGWEIGFGIPCAAMAGGLLLFLMGTSTYRHTPMKGTRRMLSLGTGGTDDSNYYGSLLRVLPIWATCLAYGIVFAQSQTFFTKQGSTLDRRIGSNFLIPPASVQILISSVIVSLIPVYDRIFVPVARYFTGIPSGITTLQRIGTGMVLSIVSMVVAAAVEARRLEIAADAGLVDEPGRTLPMSLWWLVPQYILYGVSDVFAMVGFQEFFYSEMAEKTRSLGVALYLSVFGVGNLLSGVLISVIDKVSKSSGDSWFSSNLNKAHLDYFYLLLAGLSVLSMGVYVYLSKSYVGRRNVHKLNALK